MLDERLAHGCFPHKIWPALIVTCMLVTAGCGGDLDPTDPAGAYKQFRNGLLDGDRQAVWERIDDDSHDYFQQRYEELVGMDETIKKYLPQTDYKIARHQSGVVLIDQVDDGKGLFMRIFQPAELPDTEAVRTGSDIAELKVAENDKAARVVTRAGQEYVLSRDEAAAEWKVKLGRSSDAVAHAFGWLQSNRDALQQTIEDLIDEERQKREAIISELMNVHEGK